MRHSIPLYFLVLLASAAAWLLCAPANSRAADSDQKAQLKARFEQRYPQLLKLKQEGKVGETTQGLVEAVQAKYLDEDNVKQLVEQENADRQALYKLIADEEKTTPDKVADRMAHRNFERARPGEYLKAADGTWKKKT